MGLFDSYCRRSWETLQACVLLWILTSKDTSCASGRSLVQQHLRNLPTLGASHTGIEKGGPEANSHHCDVNRNKDEPDSALIPSSPVTYVMGYRFWVPIYCLFYLEPRNLLHEYLGCWGWSVNEKLGFLYDNRRGRVLRSWKKVGLSRASRTFYAEARQLPWNLKRGPSETTVLFKGLPLGSSI